MNKKLIYAVGFIIATQVVPNDYGMCADQQSAPPLVLPSTTQDVAQVMAQLRRNLIKQEGKIEGAIEALADAREAYTENPNDSTFRAIQSAADRDSKYLVDYQKMLMDAQAIIAKAKTQYFEDTPVTKQEMTEGPKGESLEKELNEPVQQIANELSKEIEDSGGGESPFAKALAAQASKLKSIQNRVQAEQKSPAVSSNPVAQQQDTAIVNSLSNAIDARMQARFCSTRDLEECCERYPNNIKCKDEKK